MLQPAGGRTGQRRLTFCLLGVAHASDLIRDVRTTPFNIGRKIELHDFTLDEALPLAQGLLTTGGSGHPKQARKLLSRVLYWTGGQPSLTQRLCQGLFLSRRARERDDNLLFVRERLLKSDVDVPALLTLYGRVRAGKRVPDEEASPSACCGSPAPCGRRQAG